MQQTPLNQPPRPEAANLRRRNWSNAQAILLDLDRTLIDIESEVDYCAALARLQRAGFGLRDDLGAATSWGDCTRRVIDLLIGQPDRETWQRADAIVVPCELEGAERARAMPGLETLLRALTGRPVGIVTLASAAATQRVIERYGLIVDAVVARSFEVPAKPHPDQLLVALGTLGVEPAHAVMVGDSERDEMAAQAAGLAFIGVTNGRNDHRFDTAAALAMDLNEVAALLSE
ncbi:MAG: HAD family hydrolase [Proteobacteria bacterium]|nr:MAG: HAD family hydrolase [Pseudomonadota bacterium]QKK11658.1 MAG: HAD family hydrolase [Pseudomonadota bacterium]